MARGATARCTAGLLPGAKASRLQATGCEPIRRAGTAHRLGRARRACIYAEERRVIDGAPAASLSARSI